MLNGGIFQSFAKAGRQFRQFSKLTVYRTLKKILQPRQRGG